MSLNRICVFCGSSAGNDPTIIASAKSLGNALAAEGIGLVYGGASVGLMGVLADAVLQAGGQAHGVMPRALLDLEIAHTSLTSLDVVEDFHDRKARMAELSDGFLALPGGAGTLDEFFEAWTWSQLGIHRKPCGVMNVNGFFDPLMLQVDRMVKTGLMDASYSKSLIIEQCAHQLIAAFRVYEAPLPKWRGRQTSGDVTTRFETVESVAWIYIRDRRMLATRSKGNSVYYLPGGKKHVGESDRAALVREIREELGVTVQEETIGAEGIFEGQAHGYRDGTRLVMACYSAEYEGQLGVCAEIEEIRWLCSANGNECAPVAAAVLDSLHKQGRID
jgi:uncharacterized protein (TIGR00730 family)